MRAHIYQAIAEALQSLQADGQPIIRHTDLFNEQILNIEDEQPFRTPAVLIEFADTDWLKQLHGTREATVTVRLHIVTDTRVGRWRDAVERLALADSINRCLHGLHTIVENDGQNRPVSVINDFTLTRSLTDHNFDELADDIEEYQCHVTDSSGHSRF